MPAIEDLALLPPPSSAIKWKKVLWFVANTLAQSTEYLAYQYGMQMRALPGVGESGAADEWRRFVVTWDDTSSNVGSDIAQYTVDVVNYTGGAIDSSWTTQDHLDVATALSTFNIALAPYVLQRYTCTNVKAYRMAFNPMPTPDAVNSPGFKDDPFADSGPPTYSTVQSIPGTAAPFGTSQNCSSITEEVPLRGHWGRFYTPPLLPPQTANGRWASGTVDGLASIWNACLTTLASHDMYTVVPSTRAKKYPTRTLSNVTGIHVDDIPDVIRRRRPKYVQYRKRFDEATP